MGNSWVFGNDRPQDNTLPQDDQSSVACLAAQRAARKRAAASESQPAAPDPEEAAREPDPEVQESDLEFVDKEPEPAGEEYGCATDQHD